MHFSISCGLSFMCVTALLFLPAQAQLKCASSRSLKIIYFDHCTAISKAHIKEAVNACYEQMAYRFPGCNIHAYIFKGASDRCYCVDPNASWVPKRLEMLKKRGINCTVL